jgi:hypothetical protein
VKRVEHGSSATTISLPTVTLWVRFPDSRVKRPAEPGLKSLTPYLGDLCGGLSGETESREKLPRCAGFRLPHEAHLSAQEAADERAVFQCPPDGLPFPFEQTRRQRDMRMEGKSGLVRSLKESPGGAGERLVAACELGRQQDSNADVLLSSEIGNAIVPDGAWREGTSCGTKRPQKFRPTFRGDYFSRTDEGDMRRGRELAWTPVRDVCYALALAGGNGNVQVVAHRAIVGAIAWAFNGGALRASVSW